MIENRADIAQLEQKIGYQFKNREMLERALTHSSYSNELGIRNHHMCCNERVQASHGF